MSFLLRDSLDLLSLILSFSRRLHDVGRLRTCCRQWRAVLLDPSANDATRHLFADIDARFNRRVGDVAVRNVFATTALRTLALTGCAGVSDLGISWLGASAPYLESLDLSRCEAVSDTGLGHVANGCAHLVSLDLSHLPRLSDAGLAAFRRCRRLRQIVLTNTAVGNHGLYTLSRGCVQLERVYAARTCVGREGILSLAASCTGLRELCLDECSNAYNEVNGGGGGGGEGSEGGGPLGLGLANDHIDDNVLGVLFLLCKELEVLDVAHAGDVTDAGLAGPDGASLKSFSPRIRRLGLWGCAQVSAAAVAALQASGIEVSHELARTCHVAL